PTYHYHDAVDATRAGRWCPTAAGVGESAGGRAAGNRVAGALAGSSELDEAAVIGSSASTRTTRGLTCQTSKRNRLPTSLHPSGPPPPRQTNCSGGSTRSITTFTNSTSMPV